MQKHFSRRVIVCAALLFFCAPAFVRAAGGEQIAQAQTTSITGTLRTPAGAAVSGATVTATGPTRVTVTTDASGAFTLAVPPGIYPVAVTKAGYASASTNDVVVAAGTSVPLFVTIAEQNLTTLRTIGSVTASGRGGA